MTCVSSFRPILSSEEYSWNQQVAKQSWNAVFDCIILLGSNEELLSGDQTIFVPWEPFPKIKDMILFCIVSGDRWSCLVNSDIVLDARLNTVFKEAVDSCWCASSWRYEFDPQKLNFNSAKIVDNGIDFFAARLGVWKIAYQKVPDTLRIGHPFWDTWMLSFFSEFHGHFYNLTPRKMVFHPKHGGRKTVHFIDIEPLQRSIKYGSMPGLLL